jgi:hypothetical protein
MYKRLSHANAVSKRVIADQYRFSQLLLHSYCYSPVHITSSEEYKTNITLVCLDSMRIKLLTVDCLNVVIVTY